jgi:hypothetical protein
MGSTAQGMCAGQCGSPCLLAGTAIETALPRASMHLLLLSIWRPWLPACPGARLNFTYSVNWHPTNTPFARRFERYLDYSFFEHKVRVPAGPLCGCCCCNTASSLMSDSMSCTISQSSSV